MSKIIGIDLGTSNTAASVMEGGKPTIIPSAEGTSMGGKAFPSYVAFAKDGQLLVGEPARRQAVANPEGTFMAFKRKMGTDYKYKAPDGKEYTPQQLSAFLLQKVKRDAEAFLGAGALRQAKKQLFNSGIAHARPSNLVPVPAFGRAKIHHPALHQFFQRSLDAIPVRFLRSLALRLKYCSFPNQTKRRLSRGWSWAC